MRRAGFPVKAPLGPDVPRCPQASATALSLPVPAWQPGPSAAQLGLYPPALAMLTSHEHAAWGRVPGRCGGQGRRVSRQLPESAWRRQAPGCGDEGSPEPAVLGAGRRAPLGLSHWAAGRQTEIVSQVWECVTMWVAWAPI